jgi:1,4-alpha-glucan branching enzyme
MHVMREAWPSCSMSFTIHFGDKSAIPFLQELARVTHREAQRSSRKFYLIAESDLNDPRLIRPEAMGGLGLDAQWADHDQIGNRLLGDRLTGTIDFESLKLSAATVILSPFIPLLFMGEEYGEEGPFKYFVSHTMEELREAVRQGRKREFEGFKLGARNARPMR